MRPIALLLILTVVSVLCNSASAQQSDYALQKDFEAQYKAIKTKIDSSKVTTELDSLRQQIDALEIQFSDHSKFLDKALYPETFASRMADLHGLHILTYDRVYLIQTRGIRVAELEAKLAGMSARLDSLTIQRDKLLDELKETQKTAAEMRETLKRLTANLQAKDRLIFALVDSIFQPYSKDIHQVADVQKEAISTKLEKANVVTRIREIAADNVKFLDMTQLQGKDYANLIEQYQTFRNRWAGLSDKMNAVVLAGEARRAAGKKGKGNAADTVKPPPPSAQVDTVLADWHAKLAASFWAGLAKEFSNDGITLNAFSDGPGFSASIRAYVSSLKQSGQDPSAFADNVWKTHVDKDWREALIKESMLGKAEYTALDQLVSELSKEKVDLKFVLYILIIVVIAFAGWWFLVHKPKPKPVPPSEPKP